MHDEVATPTERLGYEHPLKQWGGVERAQGEGLATDPGQGPPPAEIPEVVLT